MQSHVMPGLPTHLVRELNVGTVCISLCVLTRVRMRRDFFNRLVEKYLEQLIDSVRVLQTHCRYVKANHFKHYCATACAGTCQARMRCTAALDEWEHQIWRNRFVYS